MLPKLSSLEPQLVSNLALRFCELDCTKDLVLLDALAASLAAKAHTCPFHDLAAAAWALQASGKHDPVLLGLVFSRMGQSQNNQEHAQLYPDSHVSKPCTSLTSVDGVEGMSAATSLLFSPPPPPPPPRLRQSEQGEALRGFSDPSGKSCHSTTEAEAKTSDISSSKRTCTGPGISNSHDDVMMPGWEVSCVSCLDSATSADIGLSKTIPQVLVNDLGLETESVPALDLASGAMLSNDIWLQNGHSSQVKGQNIQGSRLSWKSFFGSVELKIIMPGLLGHEPIETEFSSQGGYPTEDPAQFLPKNLLDDEFIDEPMADDSSDDTQLCLCHS